MNKLAYRQTAIGRGAAWALATLVCLGLASSVSAATPAQDSTALWWQSGGAAQVTCSVDLGLGSINTIDSMLDARTVNRDVTTRAASGEPCDASQSGENEDGASNNICFEAAGAQATVRPEFIAEYRAVQHSKRIAGLARTFPAPAAVDDGQYDRPREAGASDSGVLVLARGGVSTVEMRRPVAEDLVETWTSTIDEVPERGHQDRPPRASCSVSPVQCEGVPPGPPGIDAEQVSPIHLTNHLYTSNAGSRSNEDRIPEFRRIGPSDGHGRLPDRPPRRG